MINIDGVLEAWLPYIETIAAWENLVKGIEHKVTGCGLVYELVNPIDRPNESFAIADMCELKITEPHFHPNGAIEIYVVVQGSGLIVVGGKEERIGKDSVVVIPPDTTHFTIPTKDLVLAIINTPPFRPEDYVVVEDSNPDVGFDKNQFDKLSKIAN